MTELAGQLLLVLAVLDAAGPAFTWGGWRWVAPAQYAVLAVFALATAALGNNLLLAAPVALLVACAAGRWRRGGPAEDAVRPWAALLGALAAVGATVPFLAAAEPFPGLPVLSAAVPVAATGLLAAVLGRTEDGAATAGRAAVFAALAGPSPVVAASVLSLLLLAMEGRALALPFLRTRRAPAVAAAGLVLLLVVPGLDWFIRPPPAVAVAGLLAAGVCVRLMARRMRVGRLGAAGAALALLGAGVTGLGLPGLAPGCVLAGLALHAGSVLRGAGNRPVPALLAALLALVSVWVVRNAPPGLSVPAGLAAASGAALILLHRHPARRAAPDAAILHGGIALCAAGLGTPAALQAGMVQAAGFLLAQGGALVLPRARWPALLAMAGLPPSALFVSEFLLLREAGRVFYPLLAVLALAACAFLRRLRATPPGAPLVAWIPLAASAVLATAAWLTIPGVTAP